MNENQKKSLEELRSDLTWDLNNVHKRIKENYASFNDSPYNILYIDSLIRHLIDYRTIQNELDTLNTTQRRLEHFNK